ncbi:reverse transcriptase domain-containing protein [Tanacetum coccineum]
MVRTVRTQPARDSGDLVSHVDSPPDKGLLKTKELRMTGPEPITPLNKETTSNQGDTITRTIIEGHLSTLKEFLKEQSNHDFIRPMLLDFGDEIRDADDEVEEVVKKKDKEKTTTNDDLSKPFKEVLKCPFTRRIVEFSSSGHRMLANAKIYDGTGDPKDHVGRFVGMGNQGEWPMPACAKDPTKISKIVRRANETLPNFKERWVSESNAIPNVPELMQILSFMSSHKCPELSKRFSDNIPKTVDEMLKRVDDYLRAEEAFRNTELPKDLSHRTPIAPTTTNAVGGEAVRISLGVRQVKPVGERRKAKRKRGQQNNGPQKGKVINMVQCHSYDQKRKITMTKERWMNVPITFPLILARDFSKEALVVEAEVEGYLVQRVHIDEGASVKIMFEHCFNMLHPAIRARLVETQTTVSGFSGEQVKPLGKIELDAKAAQGHPVHHPWHGEVSNSLGNRNIGVPSAYSVRMKKGGKETSISGDRKKPLARRLYSAQKSTEREQRYFRVGTLRYDWGTKKNHQAFSQCQSVGNTSQSEKKGILLRKKPGATYQRLVDKAFKSQIGRNLEAYVDDMVVKSKSEREMLADIAETFDNLRRINMKLNPKKCSLEVEEGNFLGYMVTSEGIRANPAKTKDIVEMQSPRTWGGNAKSGRKARDVKPFSLLIG